MSRATLMTAVLVAAGSANAAVSFYTGTQIVNFQGNAEFSGVGSTNPWTEGGMTFSIPTDDVGEYTGCGGDNSGFYSNGGGFSDTRIVRDNGNDFSAVEFTGGDGWGQCTNYGYVEAYLNGILQGGADLDGTANVTVYGASGQFDELRLAFWNNDGDRDQHNFNGTYSAGLIDNVNYGQIPAPGAAGLLGVAALAAGRRRR